MTSVLYAALFALLIVWLAINVIRKRRKYRVRLGDGGQHALSVAMAAHTNAIEYIPIGLLLLFALEYNAANLLIVHALGISLLGGRLVHAKGMLSERLNIRVLGMKITLYSIIALALVNLAYLPWVKFLA